MNPLQLLSCGSDSKESACNVRDLGLIPGSGRSPGEGNGSPLQYSCLENSLDRGTIGLQSVRFNSFVTPQTVTCQVPLCMGFPNKTSKVGSHSLLQEIFLTHGSHPHLLHCRQILYH